MSECTTRDLLQRKTFHLEDYHQSVEQQNAVLAGKQQAGAVDHDTDTMGGNKNLKTVSDIWSLFIQKGCRS
jgi:predicted solute-binding protein